MTTLDRPEPTPDEADAPGPTSGDVEQPGGGYRPPHTEQRGMGGRMGAIGMPVEKVEDFGGTLRRLWHRMRAERHIAVAVVVLSIVGVSMQSVGPRILGRATNIVVDGLLSGAGTDVPALRNTLLFALGLYLASAVLTYCQGFLLAGIVQRSMARLRDEVEAKINRLPLSYLDQQSRGDVLSRVTNDIDNLAQGLQQTLSQILNSTLLIIGVVTMMFTISPLLALVALVTIPTSLRLLKFITKRSKKRFIAQWAHTGDLNGQIEETFTGHTLMKVYGQRAAAETRFDAKNEELFVASDEAQFLSGTVQPAMMFLGNLNYVIIAVVGGLQVSSGRMSIGDIQAFITYSRQFTQPLTQLASMVSVFQSSVASAERVFALLDWPDQTPDPSEPMVAEQTRGRVEFDHVSFSYDPDRPLIRRLPHHRPVARWRRCRRVHAPGPGRRPHRPLRGQPRQRPRHVDAAQRRRRGRGHRQGVRWQWAPCHLGEGRYRPPDRCRRRGRGSGLVPRHAGRQGAAHRQPPPGRGRAGHRRRRRVAPRRCRWSRRLQLVRLRRPQRQPGARPGSMTCFSPV